MKKLLGITILLAMASCSQPQTKSEGAMNAAKDSAQEVSGRVVLENPMAVLPGPVKVQLIRNGVVVAETQAERGLFRFAGNFPAGMYMLRGRTAGYIGALSLNLAGPAATELRLLLEKNTSAEGGFRAP